MGLIEDLIEQKWLKSPRIIKAFRKIKRADFLPEGKKDLADLNQALPIGCGQTISQPLVVAFMIEKLNPQKGDKILDIGSGSGWTTAILAQLVGSEGKVIGLEVISELKEFGQKNISKYNFIKEGRVECRCADGSKGFLKEAPFDRILCSAAVQNKIPSAWKKQLKVGGIIVTPRRSSIWKLTKKAEGEFSSEEHSGFAFVPLIES